METTTLIDTAIITVVVTVAFFGIWRYVRQSWRADTNSCGTCAGCPAQAPTAANAKKAEIAACQFSGQQAKRT